MSKSKHYFLDRKKQFVECEIVCETSHKRTIKITEGEKSGKIVSVHPQGAAWGKLYPRLFTSPDKPKDFFIYKGRVLMAGSDDSKKAAIPDVDANYRFQRFLTSIIDCINASEPVLATGGTGVGKTTHIEQLAARCKQPLLRINFNGETRLSDLIGKMQVIGGETKWVDGVLPMAMRHGYWLLLDEIDFAEPSVLSLLHPVIEEKPYFVLKENEGEIIKAHPNFRIFATANSIGSMQDRSSTYTGTNHMNEAFLDRWTVLMVDNLSFKEELKIVKSKVKGLNGRWAKRIVEFAQKVRERKLEGIDFSSDNFSTRRVLKWAQKTALLRNPLEGAKIAWLDKMPSGDKEALVRILQAHFGNIKRERSEWATPRKKRVNSLTPPAGVKVVGSPTVAVDVNGQPVLIPPKRGRGRPRKVKTAAPAV